MSEEVGDVLAGLRRHCLDVGGGDDEPALRLPGGAHFRLFEFVLRSRRRLFRYVTMRWEWTYILTFSLLSFYFNLNLNVKSKSFFYLN